MHRQSQEEVAAAARRRLELLGRELEQAGLRRVDDDDPVELPEPSVVAPTGRHVRPPGPGIAGRLSGWVSDQVPETLRGRTELGSGPALLVVALVALGLVGTVWVVLRMHGQSEPVPSLSGAVPSGSAQPSAPSSSPSASGAPAGKVTVDVAGKVRRPGVATLPAGARVIDALRRAGGPKTGVDLSSLNLARVLVDGEQ